MKTITASILAVATGALLTDSTLADPFGSGANTFTIDFVTIGNPGNADDAGAGGGIYSSLYGGVPYTYRIGTYEISQEQITKAVATAGGLTNVFAGAWIGSQPAANITWYEAAAFVNWLNTSTGHQAAYNLTFSGTWSMTLWSSGDAWQLGGQNLYRHKDAYYFLPSEDEWYKAAYHKNDGATANYWDYPTGSNSLPTAVASGTGPGTVVYDVVTSVPALVDNNGGLSAYGTRGQGGNVWEWNEGAWDGSNTTSAEVRSLRAGTWNDPEEYLRSSFKFYGDPSFENEYVGFRVASVPEPSAALLGGLGMAYLLARRRRAGK